MMGIIKATFVLLLVTSAGARATDIEIEKAKTKILMHKFEKELSKLRPYLFSAKAFSDPKSKTEISQILKNLDDSLKDERPTEIDQNPGFRLNYSLFAYQIKTIKRSFDQGGFEYSRQQLTATSSYCISCHTQVPAPSRSFWSSNADKTDRVRFENAEYLFTTRRFDMALEQYDQLIRDYPKSALTPDQLATAYHRKLALFARVKRDPILAVRSLTKDLANDKLPADLRENIKEAITYFEKWKAEKSSPENMNSKDQAIWINENLPKKESRAIAPAEPAVVTALRVSGLLYEKLQKEPTGPGTQEILFNLAECEKSLTPIYWYSMGHAYLRECIQKFPKSALTKKCFDAYEEDMREQFSNQSMPDEAKSSLEAMKKYLD